MNDIELIDEKYYSCFQVAIATYLKSNNFDDYWYAFPNCWVFDYERNDSVLLGDRIKSLWMSDIEELKEYTGIVLENVPSIENETYLVEIDVYDCWWSSVYKKHHMPHYFLLCKNSQKNMCIIDSFFKKRIERTTLEINTSDLKKVYKVSINNGRKLELTNIICNAMVNMFPKDASITGYEKMRELAIDILNCDYLSEIKTQNKDLYMNSLYNSFFRLEAGRYNFFKIISTDLRRKNAELFSDFEQIISSWEIIRLNISRLLLTDNTSLLKNISKSLYVLSYSEEKALNRLCQLYNINKGEVYDSNIKIKNT